MTTNHTSQPEIKCATCFFWVRNATAFSVPLCNRDDGRCTNTRCDSDDPEAFCVLWEEMVPPQK